MYRTGIPVNGFAELGDGDSGYGLHKNTHHNVATAAFQVGTKVRYYNANLVTSDSAAMPGWGTCIYLRYSAGAETLAAGYICQPDPALDSLYYVTGDVSTFVHLAAAKPNCIALTAMTTTYYGWFWCGGVCPDFHTAADTPFSETTCVTDNTLTAGEGFAVQSAGTPADDTIVAYDIGSPHAGNNYSQAGWVLADDGGITCDMANLVMIDFFP